MLLLQKAVLLLLFVFETAKEGRRDMDKLDLLFMAFKGAGLMMGVLLASELYFHHNTLITLGKRVFWAMERKRNWLSLSLFVLGIIVAAWLSTYSIMLVLIATYLTPR